MQNKEMEFATKVVKKIRKDVDSRRDVNKYSCLSLLDEYIELLGGKDDNRNR